MEQQIREEDKNSLLRKNSFAEGSERRDISTQKGNKGKKQKNVPRTWRQSKDNYRAEKGGPRLMPYRLREDKSVSI